MGSGMATIRYPTAIKLGEFHTVQLYRNQTQGSLFVDGEAPINGTSQVHIPLSIFLINMLFCGGIMAVKQMETCCVSEQGKFKGLDLNEELLLAVIQIIACLLKLQTSRQGLLVRKPLCYSVPYEFHRNVSVVAFI